MKQFLSALAVTAIFCLPAAGEEIAFGFRGTVHELDGEFSYLTGQTFEILYTFETATEDADPGNLHSGRYAGAIKSGTLTISRGDASLTWRADPKGAHSFIEVENLDDADCYSAGLSVSGPIGEVEIPVSFIVELRDESATAVSSDALPTALNVDAFRHQRIVRFTFRSVEQNTYSTIGVITAAYAPVPQPAER